MPDPKDAARPIGAVHAHPASQGAAVAAPAVHAAPVAVQAPVAPAPAPGMPAAPAAPVAPPEPDPNSPYTGPSEIVPGGRYIQGARLKAGKLYGGRVVDANGKLLATFKDDQENTGNPTDGTQPEKEG